MKNIYNTYGVGLSADGIIILYCFDRKIVSIQEFVEIEQRAFQRAMKRQWRIFKQYETFETDVELRVCMN
jgi:hypothetical protein